MIHRHNDDDEVRKYRSVFTENLHPPKKSDTTVKLEQNCDVKIFKFLNELKSTDKGFKDAVIYEENIKTSIDGKKKKYPVQGIKLINITRLYFLLEHHVPWCEFEIKQRWITSSDTMNKSSLVTEYYFIVDIKSYKEYMKCFDIKYHQDRVKRDGTLAILFFLIFFYCVYYGLMEHWKLYDDPVGDFFAWIFGVPTSVFLNRSNMFDKKQ